MSFVQGQDWESAGWGSKGPATGAAKAQQLNAARRQGNVVAEAKHMAGTNKSSHSAANVNMRKLEEDTETFKHNVVDRSLSQALIKARTDKKMNQKALGTAINEKPQVIAEYESGKAIPNGAIIAKLERALGVKLPRGPPKKKNTAVLDEKLDAFKRGLIDASCSELRFCRSAWVTTALWFFVNIVSPLLSYQGRVVVTMLMWLAMANALPSCLMENDGNVSDSASAALDQKVHEVCGQWSRVVVRRPQQSQHLVRLVLGEKQQVRPVVKEEPGVDHAHEGIQLYLPDSCDWPATVEKEVTRTEELRATPLPSMARSTSPSKCSLCAIVTGIFVECAGLIDRLHVFVVSKAARP